jgi:23S rRNA (uridine2552-2'-O)-methyltransferase
MISKKINKQKPSATGNITGRQKNVSREAITSRKTARVINKKGRKSSSVKWIARQINDPFVKAAHLHGYRCRSAFKLIEIDEKFSIFSHGKFVIDVGAAPGSWSQIAVKKCGDGNVIGIDLLPIAELTGCEFIEGDFTSDTMQKTLMDKMLERGKSFADVIMSDMASNTTGFRNADHLRTIALVESAWEFARPLLTDGGVFIAKVFMGGAETELLADLKKHFDKVRHFKPKSSRTESVENYLIATGFKNKLTIKKGV